MTVVKSRLAILFTMIFAVLIVPRVFAQEATQQTSEQNTSERCMLTQNYLNNIQKPRDLRARVDRLQGYRYIYQRIDMFTKRLERNKQPHADDLRASLSVFSKNIEDFKNRYEEYDLSREAVVGIANCKVNTVAFQEKLTDARAKRFAVNETVVALEKVLRPTISDHLDTLYQDLLSTGKTGELYD